MTHCRALPHKCRIKFPMLFEWGLGRYHTCSTDNFFRHRSIFGRYSSCKKLWALSTKARAHCSFGGKEPKRLVLSVFFRIRELLTQSSLEGRSAALCFAFRPAGRDFSSGFARPRTCPGGASGLRRLSKIGRAGFCPVDLVFVAFLAMTDLTACRTIKGLRC